VFPGFWIDEGRLPFCRRLYGVVIGSGETNGPGPGFVVRPLVRCLGHRTSNREGLQPHLFGW
jgi:hypothetical protein